MAKDIMNKISKLFWKNSLKSALKLFGIKESLKLDKVDINNPTEKWAMKRQFT